MDSRIQKDGFEYVSFSGEPSEKYDTLIVNPENFAQAVQYIRKNEITRVHVEGHDWAETPCLDVSALSQCSGIRRLSAGGCVSGVQQLVDTLHLEWLSIDDRFIRERIDLSPLTGLEYLSIYKMKKNLCGLSGLKSLKSFRSWDLTFQTGDLSALQGMTELKEMELNCPHLTSLFGISGFKVLEKLGLCYCRKDLDITDVFLSETLDCIEIEKSNPRIAESIPTPSGTGIRGLRASPSLSLRRTAAKRGNTWTGSAGAY